MNSVISQIVIVLISVIFGGLFTFFITSITQRKVFKSIAEELTVYHEKIYHKESVENLLKSQQSSFKKSLKEHEDRCLAVKDVGKLKTGVIWLVAQAGGSPKDLGLH